MGLALHVQGQAALAEYQSRLLKKFPQRIRRIALFGSKARGDAEPDSDLDVLVQNARDDKSFEEWVREQELDGLLTKGEKQKLGKAVCAVVNVLRGNVITTFMQAAAKTAGEMIVKGK